jgi:hypothetical protein
MGFVRERHRQTSVQLAAPLLLRIRLASCWGTAFSRFLLAERLIELVDLAPLGKQLWRQCKQSHDHPGSEKSDEKDNQWGAPDGIESDELDLNNVSIRERKTQHNQEK